jgi:MFS family permease
MIETGDRPNNGADLLKRNRRFRRLYYARGCSVIGSQWTYAAVPIVALAVYRDPLAAGMASACGYGGNIAFGFVAGFVVDRIPHRSLMLVADAARFVLLIVIGLLLSARQLPPLPALYATVLLVAVFSAAFDAANGGLAPRLVSRDDFAQALTMNQSRDAFIGLIMPALSAALVVRRPGLPFLVDSASYLVSFLLIRTIRVPRTDTAAGSPAVTRRWWRTAVSGLALLVATRSLGLLVAGTSVLNFGLQVCVYVTLYRAVKEGDASWAGVILGVQSLGMFVGSLVAKRAFNLLEPADITAIHACVWALGFLVIASVDRAWAACFVLPVMWLTAPAFRTVVSAHTVAVIPGDALGRAAAASGLVAMGFAAFSQTAAAIAITHGSTIVLLVGLAVLAALALVGGVALPARTERMALNCHGRPAVQASNMHDVAR